VLTVVPAAFYARMNDILLTALALAVGRWRQERGIAAFSAVLVDLEGHGRHAEGGDLSRTVGWFTSIHPVRVDPGLVPWDEVTSAGAGLGEAVKQVKEQLRGTPDEGLGYGLLRYLNPGTADVLAAAGAPQIGFNYLGRFGNENTNGDAPRNGNGTKARTAPATSWALASDSGPSAGRDDQMPAFHALDLNAFALDTPEGPVLSATWSWPDALFDRDDVEHLAGLWFSVLQALVTHARRDDAGGHTPSDLTMYGLTQADIDGLEDFLRIGDGDEK
jgi:non-ribosomal peptide synthase protein (TIGR01720 family)